MNKTITEKRLQKRIKKLRSQLDWREQNCSRCQQDLKMNNPYQHLFLEDRERIVRDHQKLCSKL